MTNYSQLAKTSSRMIDGSGRDIVLRRIEKGSYDPLSNSFSGGLTSQNTVKAVVTLYRKHEIDGEVIQQGDKKILFSPETDVRVGDTIIDGGEYNILDIEEVNPGTQAVLLKAQARK